MHLTPREQDKLLIFVAARGGRRLAGTARVSDGAGSRLIPGFPTDHPELL